jgi:hypothetical protein
VFVGVAQYEACGVIWMMWPNTRSRTDKWENWHSLEDGQGYDDTNDSGLYRVSDRGELSKQPQNGIESKGVGRVTRKILTTKKSK